MTCKECGSVGTPAGCIACGIVSSVHDDLCRCEKEEGHWGAYGWHYRPDCGPGTAYERCPAYVAAREQAA